MFESVKNLGDVRLEAYTSLTDLQLRNRLEPEMGIFIAESSKVISRALDAGYEPLSLLVPNHRVEREAQIIGRIEDAGAPIYAAPAEELEKLAGYELTRGVLAAFRRPAARSMEDVLENASRVAILEDITNHQNIGSIFRNAAAFGMDAVLVTPGCSDPLYRRAVRVSMGSVFKIPWARTGECVSEWPAKGMDVIHRLGFKVAALALHDESLALDDPKLKESDKLALLFGSEGPGIAQQTLDLCDYVVKIPMQNGVDSLNVAATSAVVFWELRRA